MEMLRQEIAGVYAKQKKTLADGSFLPPQKRIEALKKLEASIRRHEKEPISRNWKLLKQRRRSFFRS